MDPGNGRKSAYTSRICKALRCITAASSSALLTNSPRSPTSERAPHPPPSSFPPPPSPPPCLRIRPRRHERRHGGQVRLQPAQLGPSADAGRAVSTTQPTRHLVHGRAVSARCGAIPFTIFTLPSYCVYSPLINLRSCSSMTRTLGSQLNQWPVSLPALP
ncbi:hypothetical protein BD311DRAFT_753900 [Dichomitus squalens]|uniref:Uncharacterized protein n=1 Tax=Dichomitus squalens TaxID=114155 RepID=A0A4Q9MX14_9APHY|nr:hypothetical protein BD311DRAFT_753900 [Dichomitus squalens]